MVKAMKVMKVAPAKKAVMKTIIKATAMKAKQGKLTKSNVKKIPDETKDDKLKRIAELSSFDDKRAAISKADFPLEPDDLLKIFGNKEMVKNYNRFSQTESKRDSDVQDAWKSLQESREPGKEKKKRALLLAWLQDGMVMTPKFKTSCTQICFSKTRTKQLKWLTTKEVIDKYGQDEGLQMIKEGSFLVRKNPANMKFYQFLSIDDYMTLDVKKQEELRASGTSKVSDKQFSAITSSIKGVNIQDLEGDVEDEKLMNHDFGEDDFDEEEKLCLPTAQVAKPKGHQKVSPEDKVLNFDTDSQKTMPKVKYMHSVMTKDAQSLQSAMCLSYYFSITINHLFQDIIS